MSKLSENPVHYPVDGGCGHTGARTYAASLQILDDGTYQWKLHVWRIWYDHACGTLAGDNLYGVVIEDGEAQHALVSDNLHPIFFSRLMAGETPRAATGQPVLETETGTDAIFCCIQSGTVGTDALSSTMTPKRS